jgi:hypothetical protein
MGPAGPALLERAPSLTADATEITQKTVWFRKGTSAPARLTSTAAWTS